MKCPIKILNAHKPDNNENINILFNKISTQTDFTDISSIYNERNRLNVGDKVPGVTGTHRRSDRIKIKANSRLWNKCRSIGITIGCKTNQELPCLEDLLIMAK